VVELTALKKFRDKKSKSSFKQRIAEKIAFVVTSQSILICQRPKAWTNDTAPITLPACLDSGTNF
jgi:hypothetical protein